jgi:hypothetical protein
LLDKLGHYVHFLLSALIDIGFMALLFPIQKWFHDYILVPYELQGLDKGLSQVLQAAFGVVTVLFVLGFVIMDLMDWVVSVIIHTRSAWHRLNNLAGETQKLLEQDIAEAGKGEGDKGDDNGTTHI